jgi:uncharacterized protein YqeY
MIERIKKARLSARLSAKQNPSDAKYAVAASILGVLIAELDRKQNHSDDACMKAIRAVVKSNVDAIAFANDEMKTKLNYENDTLVGFLPKALTGDELVAAITEICRVNDISSIKGMGRVMGELKKTGMLIDGNEARQILMKLI